LEVEVASQEFEHVLALLEMVVDDEECLLERDIQSLLHVPGCAQHFLVLGIHREI